MTPGIHGRPRFAKHSVDDGEKVEIAPIHPDFSLSLMESADRVLSKAAHFSCTAGARFGRSRSDLSCHHFMIAQAIGSAPVLKPVPFCYFIAGAGV